jgi:HAD superfamily hydrolase (TIGR01490 family)
MGRAAFFDVDNTLLDAKSMFSFQRFYLDEWLPWHGGADVDGTPGYAGFSATFELLAQRLDRAALNRRFYESYAGHSQRGLREAAQAWFAQLLAQRGEALWIKPALAQAEALRAEGFTLVAVSGSSHEILAPVLQALGFGHCLATTLEVEGDRLTGHIVPPQMIGEGKAVALRRWADEQGIDLARSVACGDHFSDLPMLACVGRALVVAGDPALEREAAEHGWPVLRADTVTDSQGVHA